MMESENGESIPVGTVVTLSSDGQKIRPCLRGENPVGVIVNEAAMVCSCNDEEWYGKYDRDESGSIIYEDVEIEEEVPVMEEVEIKKPVKEIHFNGKGEKYFRMVSTVEKVMKPIMDEYIMILEDGKKIDHSEPRMNKVKRIERRPKISPLFKPDLKYVGRSFRKEWHKVAIAGRVSILRNQFVSNNWINRTDGLKYNSYIIR